MTETEIRAADIDPGATIALEGATLDVHSVQDVPGGVVITFTPEGGGETDVTTLGEDQVVLLITPDPPATSTAVPAVVPDPPAPTSEPEVEPEPELSRDQALSKAQTR